MISPSDRIWALVSGFPAPKRHERLLGMFQAYIDESVGKFPGGIFAMCGFLSTPERWAAFSDEWQRHLDFQSPNYRKLDSFHLKEMRSERDRERIDWFINIIEEHAQCGICIFIDLAALRRTWAEFDWPEGVENCKNPYLWAFQTILGGKMSNALPLAGARPPIDFYFDETCNKTACMLAWDEMKEKMPGSLRLIGETPAFRSDKNVLPLQAADLLAGTTRKWAEGFLAEGNVGSRLEKAWPGPAPGFPWSSKSRVQILFEFLAEDDFREPLKYMHEYVLEQLATFDRLYGRSDSPP